MTKHVYAFTEGDRDMKDLLGEKGVNLAEMVKLGLPAPPGFTVTIDMCRAYLIADESPETPDAEVMSHLRNAEQEMGKYLGDKNDPPFASVRSGAKFSMSGMMETVLNISLNGESVQGFATQSGNERFAWDSYRHLIRMFGRAVQNISGDKFADILYKLQADKDYLGDPDITVDDLKHLVEEFRKVVKDETGEDFPQDPRKQLDLAVEVVFRSRNTGRARPHRCREHIPNELGTAVNVCMVMFGNIGETSGTGVCFARDPPTSHSGVCGGYLVNARGEDVAAGIRNALSLADLKRLDRKSYDELRAIMNKLETHYRDLCDIEFTVQQGKLWMLQTRVGKRTPAAAFRVATQLADERLITSDEAVIRVTGDQLTSLLFPQFDKNAGKKMLTKGMPASPGAVAGEIVLNNEQAASRIAAGASVILVRRETNPDDLADMVAAGASVILVRRETNPDDLADMVAASGVLTARGGKISHAAVVARGMGHCCVVGAENLAVDEEAGIVHVKSRGVTLKAGDIVAIDGTTGEVFQGEVPAVDSPVMIYITHGLDAALSAGLDADTEELVCAVDRILTQADEKRNLAVRADADTPKDAERARSFGAQDVELCRTEYMFLGDRRKLIESVILADTTGEQGEVFDALRPSQKDDLVGISTAIDGLPVTVRLIDPPLHEFLPDLTELSIELAVRAARGEEVVEHEKRVLEAVKANHGQNPMLGLRGVCLDLKIRGLFKLQVRAIVETAVECKKKGFDLRPEIMAPLIGSEHELQIVHDNAERIIGKVERESGVELDIPIGNMIKLPRAVLEAGHIAVESDFFSFGTNDLTQTTWGFSHDDVEASFFNGYFDCGIFGISPFEAIDANGVGQLVETGATRGRVAKPGLKCGACGEHGDDPASIHPLDKLGPNYVSCSPFRVPVARLESGRAAISNESAGTSR